MTMGIIAITVFFGLVVLAGIGVAVFAKNSVAKGVGALVALVVVVLTGAIWFFSAATSIGPSDVGIETAFGRTVGDLGPGFHLIAPWDGVTTWDGAVQTITYGRDLNQAKSDHCLLVRIGGQQSACLALTFQYQIRKTSADTLFRRYRNQANMNDKLVVRSLDQAVNTQLANFSPIEAAAACNGKATCSGESLVPFESQIKNEMRTDIGQDIYVESLFIPYVAYDSSLTGRLNQIQNQRADTLIAEQLYQTNLAIARANKALATSISHDPGITAANCLYQVLVPMVKANLNPAGVICPGGTTGSSGGQTVVVTK